jgi:tetratricopeptide (TPR) repeat protein
MSRFLACFAALFWLLPTAIAAAAEAAPAQSTPPAAAEGAAAAASQPPELEEAFKVFRAGDLDRAMKTLQAAAQKNPDLAPAQVIMAKWFMAANQGDMARGALERATSGAPNDPEAYQILGDVALRNRQVTEAGLLFEKAYGLARNVKEPGPRITALKRRTLAGLAMVAEARQDWPGAQTQLEALLAEDPKDAAALEQLGHVLFVQKKEDLAVEKLREAAKLNPAFLNAEATVAQLYQQAGDVKNAGKWMLESIKANPRDAKTRIAAAQWSFEIGKLDQAEEQAKAAAQLEPGSLNAQLVRGLVALLRKDYKTAEEFYEKAHLQAPSNFAATNNLAMALLGQDEESKKRLGLEYAQINTRVFSDESEAFSTAGWAFYRLGRIEEAEANLRKAANMPRPSPDTFYFLARLMLDRGRREEAKMLLQTQALKSSAPFLMRKEAEALNEELSGR